MNGRNLCAADLNDGVGLKTCRETLKRPNSPAVRGFGGIEQSPRQGLAQVFFC